MHDECLREIYTRLSPEAQKVFVVLDGSPEGCSIEDLMQTARLSTHRVRIALSELRGATLATRNTPTRLTANGRQLRDLLSSGAAK